MADKGRLRRAAMALSACLGFVGCLTTHPEVPNPPAPPLPRELTKVVLPDYIIEPPDILLVDALSVVPKPPYHIATGDVLIITVPNAFPTDPISGLYPVEPGGTVNLGLAYGAVSVVGKTLEEARAAIEDFLRPRIKDVKAVVALGQSRALQQIRGQHLVTPDGKVRMGLYGAVRIAGLTVPQAKAALEAYLGQYLDKPELSVDVIGYNSKTYYVIFDGGGNGQTIYRLPVTGNDTVLEAMAQVGGLTPVSSHNRIWVARPAPENNPCDQVLPVDWCGITTRGRVETNYQLLPGDRIYVQANPLVTVDTFLSRLYSPIERTLGVTLLGTGTVSSIVNIRTSGTGGGSGVP
jgi:polysaccharide export outer membrane protein